MRIAVIGGGGHGKVLIDIISKSPEFILVGVLDARKKINESILDQKVIGRDVDLKEVVENQDIVAVAVAIGDNALREKVVGEVKDNCPNLIFPNLIHPSAQIGLGVQMGNGNVFMPNACVNCDSKIGDFCIFNTNCSVDHDSEINDFVSLAPNSSTGGNVSIGKHSAICLGANVIHRITIGSNTVVGAGSTVTSDIESDVLAYGTPARIVKRRKLGDAYL